VIPVVYLKASPFYIEWAAEVYAAVTAINDYGYSEESEPGNGANLQTNPDPPHSLIEVFEDRTASDVGLSWQPGFDGGTPVTSYDI